MFYERSQQVYENGEKDAFLYSFSIFRGQRKDKNLNHLKTKWHPYRDALNESTTILADFKYGIKGNKFLIHAEPREFLYDILKKIGRVHKHISKFLTTKNALNEFKLFFIRTFSTAENSYKHIFVLKNKLKFLLINKTHSLL